MIDRGRAGGRRLRAPRLAGRRAPEEGAKGLARAGRPARPRRGRRRRGHFWRRHQVSRLLRAQSHNWLGEPTARERGQSGPPRGLLASGRPSVVTFQFQPERTGEAAAMIDGRPATPGGSGRLGADSWMLRGRRLAIDRAGEPVGRPAGVRIYPRAQAGARAAQTMATDSRRAHCCPLHLMGSRFRLGRARRRLSRLIDSDPTWARALARSGAS